MLKVSFGSLVPLIYLNTRFSFTQLSSYEFFTRVASNGNPSVCLTRPWNSWTVVALPFDGESIPDPLVGTVFLPHRVLWRGGQFLGWLQSFPTVLGILVAHYLVILSWITSLLIFHCSWGQFPNIHVLSPCALWVPNRCLADILQTWWLQSCLNVTHVSHLRAILTPSVFGLSLCLPYMGCMGWSGTHMPLYPLEYSYRTVVRCVVGCTTPFVFERIGAVSTCCSW